MIGSQGPIVAVYLGLRSDAGDRGRSAVGRKINGFIGLNVERRKMLAPLKLRPRSNAAGQFEMISDVEEFDHVVVIPAELNKSMGA